MGGFVFFCFYFNWKLKESAAFCVQKCQNSEPERVVLGEEVFAFFPSACLHDSNGLLRELTSWMLDA